MDAGKYHATLLILISTLEQWLKNTFYHKEHISFHHKIPERRSKENKQLRALHIGVTLSILQA